MGLLKWLADRISREVLKLHIYMRYSLETGRGAACVRWNLLDPSLRGNLDVLRCCLVALLYARILTIHHADRVELFDRVGRATAAFLAPSNTTPLQFETWTLDVYPLGQPFVVWPWAPLDSTDAPGVKGYTATLRLGRPTRSSPVGLGIDLEMHLGAERVKAPGCVLIAISELFQDLKDPFHQRRLAEILVQINRYFGSAEHAALMSEGMALAAAVQGIALEDQ